MKLLIKSCKIIIFSIILVVLTISTTIIVNREMVRPKKHEILAMEKFYSKLMVIKKKEDIITLQNYTIRNIKHSDNGIGEINIQKVIKSKKGLCFHRSLLLQKVMIMNGISVRPVYLYSMERKGSTKFFSIFSSGVHSHNIFEFKWKQKWYVMRTNTMMYTFEHLNEYLRSQRLFFQRPRFIRFLNNRNGRFISPSFLPDIYFF
jgi:hypothetical protein